MHRLNVIYNSVIQINTIHWRPAVGLFTFHDKPPVCVLIKSKIIQFLYRLFSFRYYVDWQFVISE